MEANVSPDSPVVTFWEGEIVDNVNHTFITSKWLANQTTDMDSWSKFPPFRQLKHKVVQSEGQCGILREYPYVFMRWKVSLVISHALKLRRNNQRATKPAPTQMPHDQLCYLGILLVLC